MSKDGKSKSGWVSRLLPATSGDAYMEGFDADSDDDNGTSPHVNPRNRKNSFGDEDNCIICLQMIKDRTILPQCSHDSQCFSCLIEWASELGHSSKCPLCVCDIGPYIIHNVRNKYDYERFFISPALSPGALARSKALNASRRRSSASRGDMISSGSSLAHSQRLREEARRRDELDAAVMKRRHVYHNGLYAKHVATNRYTGYTPQPTPAQISASVDLQRRAMAFLRRELRVWINIDIEFLANYISTLIKSIDLRSDAGIKLLAELMDPGIPTIDEGRRPNTEQLSHELYSFLRSPYKQVELYDKVVQYERSTSSLYGSGLRRRSVVQGSPKQESSSSNSSQRSIVIQAKVGVSGSEPAPSSTGINGPSSLVNVPMDATSEHHTISSGSEAVKLRASTLQYHQVIDPLPASEGISAASLTASRREELLSRLDAEKARLNASHPLHEEDEIPSTEGAPTTGLQIRGAAVKARELLERRLRTQALLRVRLAREKGKLAESGLVEGEREKAEREDVGEGFGTAATASAEMDQAIELQQRLREKLLREKLLLSRRK